MMAPDIALSFALLTTVALVTKSAAATAVVVIAVTSLPQSTVQRSIVQDQPVATPSDHPASAAQSVYTRPDSSDRGIDARGRFHGAERYSCDVIVF
ncbi:hypothetical protein DPMN_158357 [Dreissena polymorpha]|uniref:Secreted protein n=1 Tax=Dreissena polymorpha TaxID=45954 RepID=A0A9D4EM60_DREPO|nr:hypothetical protein DPMN_158357 [Dreissena polymorpha]